MNYVYAGYGVTIATLVLYAARVLVRGRTLRRAVGENDRSEST